MSRKPDSVTRRDVLRGAGAMTASLGAVSLGACQGSDADRWDLQTDVLIVGSGVGGATAALIAYDNGNDVTIVEKASEPGGTTAKSAGVFWIPNNFTLKEKGIDDARDDCLQYMTRFSYPERYDPDSPTLGVTADEFNLLAAFYDNSAAAVDQLRAMDALNTAEWRMFALDRPATDYLDQVPENKVPAGRPLGPVTDDGSMGLGGELMRQLIQAIDARDVPLLTEHSVSQIVLDGSGRAIGVRASAPGGVVSVRARKGVVFATGGYAHNREFVDRYQPHRLHGACAKADSTGDFISIAGAAGAAMGNLGGAWRSQIALEEALISPYLASGVFYPPGDSMLQVNRYGFRVVNEHRNYNDRTEAHGIYDASRAEYPNQLLFMVYDQRTAETFAGAYPLPENADDDVGVIRGDSLAGLAAALRERLEQIASRTGGVSLASEFTANLGATIRRFNGFARSGRDTDFGRGAAGYDNEWHPVFSPRRAESNWAPNENPSVTMHPLDEGGPFFAIILAAGALDTNGGPLIDASARVLDTQGQPIPGLYAAGNCVASPSREAYYGAGHTIGMAMTFGYIAGNAVHADVESTA